MQPSVMSGRARPRWSLALAAGLVAFASVSRPQTVLFLPAVLAALWPDSERSRAAITLGSAHRWSATT